MYHVSRPTVTTVESHTCGFHERHPGRNFPGCTCSTSVSVREKTLDEMTDLERKQYAAALAGEDIHGNPLF